jgi:N-acetylmuramoyl-L-alanine amidase
MIYNHPNNARMKEIRPNPNILYPGDRFYVPDKQEKQESRSTEQRHRFQKPPTVKVLRIAVEDGNGKRLSNTPYELTVKGQVYRGATDGQGILEEKVLMEAEAGTLRIQDYVWPLLIGHLNPMDHTPDNGVSGYQARLRNLGYNPGPIDGICGPRTRAAVRAFQRDNPPLEVDGIVGPKTRAKLLERYGC